MATVSFHLKRPTAVIPTAIVALVTFDKQRIKVYTGLSILPKQWLKDDQRAKLKGYPQNGSTNDTLDLLQSKLLDCYAQQRAAGLMPTADMLKALAAPEQAVVVPKALSFWDYFAEWIEITQARGKKRTAQTYMTARRHLKEFEAAKGYAIGFDTVTPQMGDKYTAYLLNLGLTDNTIEKSVSRLKRFMKYTADRGFHTNTGYLKLNWRRQEPDIMTLTAEDVASLEALELPEGSYLENARALFLLSCYTGLRYSDLVSIRPEHIRGNALRLTTLKTRDTVSIPLQVRALLIVTRYVAGGVRLISNAALNRALKELGQAAGITAPLEVVRYRGGERLATTVPKWQKLSCHTGRRTFVTLSLERGMRPELVMKITGHRDWKSFKRYVNITEQTVEREFAKVYDMPELLKVAR